MIFEIYLQFVLFADDTNILCKHENYVSSRELVNIELSKFLLINYH